MGKLGVINEPSDKSPQKIRVMLPGAMATAEPSASQASYEKQTREVVGN